ncbi:MAG TPA: ABC transporter ATP-binding protein [Actinomycetota bacterium]|nr:ABC transporter ATP-binding protein [Actinomycetota bacterium]
MGLEVDVTIHRGDFTVRAAFDVADGQTVALLGPNGAGKSTLVEAIAGLVPVGGGSIRLDGAEIHELPPERRPIGIAFQDALLFPRLSVLENVAFPLRARGGRADAARAAAREVLTELAAGVPADAKPAKLSGGQRQRVALARALVAEPRLLLLDEPLAAVDASGRPELRSLLRRTLAGFAGPRVLVSHDPVESMTLADRIVVLEGGRVTQLGTPEEIRAQPRTRYAADLVGVNLFEGTLRPLEDGAAALDTPDGQVIVALPAGMAPFPAGAVVRGRLSPTDVSIHVRPPEGSPRNVFPGTVEEIAILGDRGRVRLRTTPPLVAEVTVGSIERLGLEPGDEVWATFKAVEVQVMEQTPAPDTL